jgi:hypothetical protein
MCLQSRDQILDSESHEGFLLLLQYTQCMYIRILGLKFIKFYKFNTFEERFSLISLFLGTRVQVNFFIMAHKFASRGGTTFKSFIPCTLSELSYRYRYTEYSTYRFQLFVVYSTKCLKPPLTFSAKPRFESGQPPAPWWDPQ